MPRLTTLVLAGALGWPAVTFAQVLGPRPADDAPATRPADPALAAPAAAGPVARPEVKQADAAMPVVPPLPPSGPLPASASAAMPPGVMRASQNTQAPELPKPTPLAPRPPDVSGMPPGMPAMRGGMHMPTIPPVHPYGVMPPGTMAPAIPPVCCPPEPPACTTCNESGCFAFGEAIMWRARQNNPVAVFERTTADVFNIVNSEAVAYNTDHTWGFRAGGGYLCDSGWLFSVTYTQYKDLVSEQLFTVPDVGLDTFQITYTGPGFLSGSPSFGIGGSLQASWNLQYRTIDILVGTVFSPSDYLDLTVQAGARLAWIDQDYNVAITSIDEGGSITAQRENLRLDLHGAGPHVAAEARVYLAPCFAVYGRGATTLLLANREDESLSSTVLDGALVETRTVRYSREEITPVFEISFGGEASCLDGRLTLNAGYEFLYLYELATSVGELTNQSREPNHGDISLDGVYIRVTFLF